MPNRSKIRARLLLGSFAALVAVQAAPVFAQEAAATEAPDANKAAEDVGADIIVTATKRPTTELQAPVSLTVVSGDALEARGLSTLSDLGAKIPSLNIGTGQPTDSIFVRGVGSGTDRGFEQSVRRTPRCISRRTTRCSSNGSVPTRSPSSRSSAAT